jgi:hypothetical protein
MSLFVNVLADVLVAVLLIATIASSIALSRRISRLKSDESVMRRTATDLMLATETAERAIAGLRTTLGECDRTLADRLRTAERYAADLAVQVAAGDVVINRIAQIVDSSRQLAAIEAKHRGEPSREMAKAAHGERLSAAATAAQNLAEKAARRFESQAA